MKDKVFEIACVVACFQETKKEMLDLAFIKNVYPPWFDNIEFLPSIGASGVLLVAWKSSLFRGEFIFSNDYAMYVEFHSQHDSRSWLLTNVYAPLSVRRETSFSKMFKHIQMPEEVDWLILGDFNLIRRLENRNKGGDIMKMFIFNEAISTLGLNEIVLQGRKFISSNK
jgi:hypothetical protein